jgi:hypothetical protein
LAHCPALPHLPFAFNFISSLLFAGTLTGGPAAAGPVAAPADALLALRIALRTLQVAGRMLF